jgi:hypothetical protein
MKDYSNINQIDFPVKIEYEIEYFIVDRNEEEALIGQGKDN